MENSMIIKQALESYKREVLGSLGMLEYTGMDYGKQILILQKKQDEHLKRKNELDAAIAEIDKELLNYVES